MQTNEKRIDPPPNILSSDSVANDQLRGQARSPSQQKHTSLPAIGQCSDSQRVSRSAADLLSSRLKSSMPAFFQGALQLPNATPIDAQRKPISPGQVDSDPTFRSRAVECDLAIQSAKDKSAAACDKAVDNGVCKTEATQKATTDDGRTMPPTGNVVRQAHAGRGRRKSTAATPLPRRGRKSSPDDPEYQPPSTTKDIMHAQPSASSHKRASVSPDKSSNGKRKRTAVQPAAEKTSASGKRSKCENSAGDVGAARNVKSGKTRTLRGRPRIRPALAPDAKTQAQAENGSRERKARRIPDDAIQPCDRGKDHCSVYQEQNRMLSDDEDPHHYDKWVIQCDGCDLWYHTTRDCSADPEDPSDPGLNSEIETWEIYVYYCFSCRKEKGPSIRYPHAKNDHRNNPFVEDADRKLPCQVGTPKFLEFLTKLYRCEDAQDVIFHMKGRDLQLGFLETYGFSSPILVEEKTGLSLVVPEEPISFKHIADFSCIQIDGTRKREMTPVLDSRKQGETMIDLDDFVKYMTDEDPLQARMRKEQSKVLNVVSFEFSDTPLDKRVRAPAIVLEMSWADKVWPDESNDVNAPPPEDRHRPRVEKFCLMTTAKSYTDFHIDFGGTCVWYHVFSGRKVFYLIRPTPANLKIFRAWQNDVQTGGDAEWLFKRVPETEVFRLELQEGNTIFLPSGWIHAVYTPVDTIVFGGNFLNNLCIESQLEIYEIEKELVFQKSHRFPYFEEICAYATDSIISDVQNSIEDTTKPPPYLVRGLDKLAAFLANHPFEQRDVYTGRPVAELILEAKASVATAMKQWPHLSKATAFEPMPQAERNKYRHCASSIAV